MPHFFTYFVETFGACIAYLPALTTLGLGLSELSDVQHLGACLRENRKCKLVYKPHKKKKQVRTIPRPIPVPRKFLFSLPPANRYFLPSILNF